MAVSPSAPPTYEEAMGHRTIEAAPAPLAYDGPGLFDDPLYLSTAHYGNSHLSGEELSTSQAAGASTSRNLFDFERDNTCTRMMLPPMHMCMAAACLICNMIIPGIGTILAGIGACCCTDKRQWTCCMKFGSLCLCFLIGILQMALTPVLLLGWVWSILWGFAFVGAAGEYHRAKESTTEGRHPLRRGHSVAPQTTSTDNNVTVLDIESETDTARSAIGDAVETIVQRPRVIQVRAQIVGPPSYGSNGSSSSSSSSSSNNVVATEQSNNSSHSASGDTRTSAQIHTISSNENGEAQIGSSTAHGTSLSNVETNSNPVMPATAPPGTLDF